MKTVNDCVNTNSWKTKIDKNKLIYRIKDECLSIDEDFKCYYKDTNPFPDDKIANEMIIIDFWFDIKFYPDGIRWRLYDLKRYLQDIMERNLDLKVVI